MTSHAKTYNQGDFVVPGVVPITKTGITQAVVSARREILFTDVTIKNIKPESNRVIYWAVGLPGFGIRVSPNGTKAFIFRYRQGHQIRTKTYGQYPKKTLAQARKEFTADYEAFEHGADPAAAKVTENIKERACPTVNQLIDEYEAHCKAIGIKSVHNAILCLKRDFGRLHGSKKVNTLTKADIRLVNKEILERGSPGGARESWQYMRRILNLAIDWDYIEKNPAAGMKAPAPKGSVDRVLSPKEIYLFWHGINRTPMNEIIRAALKMMLATLQRGIEVREAQWKYIISEEKFWEIPDPKNTIYHRIALNSYALALIEDMKAFTAGCPYVFGISHHHRSKATPDRKDLEPMRYETLSENIRPHCTAWGCDSFTPHDLRRTATTTLTGVGVPRFFVKKALNHADNDGSTPVYDRYAYDYEKQKVADVWGFVLDKILAAETVDQVPPITKLREMVKESGILR